MNGTSYAGTFGLELDGKLPLNNATALAPSFQNPRRFFTDEARCVKNRCSRCINAKPNDGNDETIGLCFMLILPIIALR